MPRGGSQVPSQGGWFEALAGSQRDPLWGGSRLRPLSGTQRKVLDKGSGLIKNNPSCFSIS